MHITGMAFIHHNTSTINRSKRNSPQIQYEGKAIGNGNAPCAPCLWACVRALVILEAAWGIADCTT
jgi:hypothetical protein